MLWSGWYNVLSLRISRLSLTPPWNTYVCNSLSNPVKVSKEFGNRSEISRQIVSIAFIQTPYISLYNTTKHLNVVTKYSFYIFLYQWVFLKCYSQNNIVWLFTDIQDEKKTKIKFRKRIYLNSFSRLFTIYQTISNKFHQKHLNLN